MKKFKLIIITLLLLLVVSLPIFSSTHYDNGSQRFTISLGTQMPLTFTNFNKDITAVSPGLGHTGMNFGGFGSIAYQIFISPYLAVGGELGYQFNYIVDGSLYTAVPMLAKLSYFPLQGTFDIPLSFGFGATYLSVNKGGNALTMLATFEAGFDWYITDNWGLGIKTGINIIPELYFDKDKFINNSLATFMPITLAVTYRQ